MLGRDKCRECSSRGVVLLLAFGTMGIVLIALITLLSLTITEGTINGVIFSAAFLHLNMPSFFPHHENSNLFVILISWLNLDFGFNVCFTSSLTSYSKTWLQFIFPLYLYSIEIILIISSYRSSKLARITGARNRLKIMSTIFLLGYMKIFRAAILILSYARIQSVHNSSNVEMVWLYDGNIAYYSGHHTPLFVVAVLFLSIIALPYTCYLLLVQVLQRLPYFPCKVKRDGIGDAHMGPFKKQFRFWLGLLLLSYTFLVILYYSTGGDRTINLTALTLTSSTLLLLRALCRGVYKNRYVDYLESLLLFNVLMLSLIVLVLHENSLGNVEAALYSLMSTAFFLSIVTLVYHLVTIRNKSTGGLCSNLSKSAWSDDKSLNQNLLDGFEMGQLDTNQPELPEEKEYNLDSLVASELVPANWLPTLDYPTPPKFREDPNLLKAEDATALSTRSNSSSEKPSVPNVVNVRPSFLVVNNSDDEASLFPCPDDELMRSQRLSVDPSGDSAYIVEDFKAEQNSPHMTNETDKCTVEDKSDGLGRSCSNKITELEKEVKEPQVLTTVDLKIRQPLPRRRPRRICKRPQPGTICYRYAPSLFLQKKIKKFKVGKRGGKYTVTSHDITLKIPPLAIREESGMLDIEVGVALNGPFVFPPHVRPISPIVWICVGNKTSLCKRIEVTLPHFIKTLEGSDPEQLGMQFMKADHHPRVRSGRRIFMFDYIGNRSTTSFVPQFGKLHTDHFCFLCITASQSRALYERASYCLIRADPITWNPVRKQEISFIVSYNIKTCLEVS